ncbi:hypothetical protein OAS86_06355 [Gammaproteobacteria bacterium]|nr:hypothetical protein [Gammaproteobacteria bacterium]
MIGRAWLVVAAMLLAGCGEPDRMEWVVFDVNEGGSSGDAHLLRFPGGEQWMIDTGFSHIGKVRVVPWLVENGVDHLDTVLITHGHRNHYGTLAAIHQAGIKIDRILFNFPPRSICHKERWATGCRLQHVHFIMDYMEAQGVPIEPITTGMLYEDGDTRLEVLRVYDGLNTPIGALSTNDTSPLMRLEVGNMAAILGGDIGSRLGRWLADNEPRLKADILLVPHHGVEDTVSDSFLAAVNPAVAIVPGPGALWDTERAERIRTWFASRSVPVRVVGKEGHLKVTINSEDYRIEVLNDAEGH